MTVRHYFGGWPPQMGESLIIRCFHKIGILSDFYFSVGFI